MALVDMSVVEQRYRAVLAVQAGEPVIEVAARLGVSRQTRARLAGPVSATAGWPGWRTGRTGRPSCPHQAVAGGGGGGV